MERLRKHIEKRIATLKPQLENARTSYFITRDESWAGRIQELDGRLSELETILHKIK